MPKPSRHALIWSQEYQYYELHMHGQGMQCFRRGDEPAWRGWLAEHSAFTFQGQAGRLSVLKEGRPRGSGYWYAYRTRDRHTSKRYLGSSARMTFARLEEQAKVLNSEPSPDPLATLRTERQDEQKVALLSSRLSHPRLPLSIVERQRLLRELDAALAHPLTLVSASAGSGKTTLLSAWVAALSKPQVSAAAGGAEHAIAWLSLEELDNDPVRFWASLIAALSTCQPKLGVGALAMLHSPQPPPLSSILTSLLHEILQIGSDIILILDDYHLIDDTLIQDAMLFLLDHLPANLHLVLATRSDPEFPLSRWRVRGQMVEIRDRDLRFTQSESTSFLTQGMGLSLSAEDVATLSKRTEGWIAGLQLAALSMRKRQDLPAFVKDFSGSHRFLLDYVQQEILARLPGTLQHFLLQTSILTSMNAALCQAVTAAPGRQGSQEMLEELERANLFVAPLDSERQCYRFHDLFREALRARLHTSRPELVPLLHIRAARWYEAACEWREAIAHALAAPDYLLAASLMEHAATQFWLRGEVRIVYTWVFSLPDTVLRAHVRLALDAALRLVNSVTLGSETVHASIQARVERTRTRMEGIMRRQQELALSDGEVALIHRRLHVLRALVEVAAIVKRGDTERLRLLSEEIEALPQDEEVSWNMIPLYFAFWRIALLQGEGASLIARLLAAKQSMIEAGDSLVTIRVMTWLAQAYIQAAQLHLAQRECLEALALVEQSGARTIMSGYLYYFLFYVSYTWNRLEESSDWLQRLQQIAYDWQLMDLLVRGEICSARLGLARGDLVTARQALQELEALVEQEGFANHAPRVITLRVQLWLAQGKLAEASEWAAQTTLAPDAWGPLRKGELLMLARVSLARQQKLQAVETLERWSRRLDRPGDIDTAIEFLVLYVVALHQSAQREQAQRVAARLLALTEPEGYIRVYLDAGAPMKQVLGALLEAPHADDPCAAAVAISRSYVARLLRAFRSPTHRREASPVITQKALPSPTHSAVQPALIEPLSPQELRVLRLLVAGQTYREMAEALIVSPNTIKTQVSSIYRKLGVSRRTAAIALTRRLHLL